MVKNLRNHIDFMGQFLDDTNRLLTQLLKDMRASYNISKEQEEVIMILHNEEALTLSQITERQGVNKAAVSRRIKKLIQTGLVRWEQSEEHTDQRYKYITLTDKGNEYSEKSRNVICDIVGQLLSDLDGEEIDLALTVLEKIDKRLKHYLNN
ncbi:MarR family transcriptional regulator [Staphylococcus pettenkoferi]|uniref:MarR family winged helix-turn-helix transcriptional regulator n=1 Tax=Staphylococcus pettenkoferi TaxID=170573 RepID=UPI0011A951E9|nr:MarR family transcriptional regulator [Staphylococcus pettenkoferi]MCY1590304.1 MarR family transcriptional regulator [Staphylococcus pettenkoferi]MCY1596198.1 MarR family transcriptional regulator [Staphylococcus pettenkoferi]MCY1600293.1 MarR family transcriptional regulator [Staphylococcus pettenkoferi]MCY1601960.1 MarR family transcriptional regulator [Staphylococcus pettenkoferi]MCY1608442.1 MarR family transcriptional regulator [Staphylococcus pettenkoferi]